jgi:hypothetical protein
MATTFNPEVRELTTDEMVTVSGGNPVVVAVGLLAAFIGAVDVGMIGDSTTTNVNGMINALMNGAGGIK